MYYISFWINKLLKFRINCVTFISFQKYFGSLNLFSDKYNVLEDIANGRSIFYRIEFPTQNPLPEIKSILLDNRPICTGIKGKQCN
jgi:hypothetical protein